MLALRNRLALVLGVWTAATLGPPATYVVAGPFDAAVSPREVAVVAGLFLAGALAARALIGRMDDPATRLREGVELAGLMALPGLTALAAFPLVFVDTAATAVAFGAGGAAGFLTAFLVGYLADRAVIARARDATEHGVTFSAKKRPASRLRLAFAVAGVVGAAVWGAVTIADGPLLAAFVPAMLGLSQLGPLLQGRVRRRYEITDRGLINWIGYLPW